MAVDFDNFPVYDPLIKQDTNRMSDIWVSALASFIQTLSEYLSQNGVFVPPLTTDQRDDIQVDSLVNGQLIYNTTLNKFQGYENGAWVNLI